MCWCAELVALRGAEAAAAAAAAWVGEPTGVPPARAAAGVEDAHRRGAAAGAAWRYAVPTVALLEHDEALEEAVLDEDEGREGRALDPGERVASIAPRGRARAHRAFGSTVRADLARLATRPRRRRRRRRGSECAAGGGARAAPPPHAPRPARPPAPARSRRTWRPPR